MKRAQLQLLAAQTLLIVAGGANLDKAFVQQMRTLDEPMSPALHGQWKDIAYGCQRYLGTLKGWLSALAPKKIPAPEIEALLYVALYELHYTRHKPHAIVHEAVNAAATIERGRLKGFVNAILRRFLRDESIASQRNSDEARYNFPQWWLDALKRQHPNWPDIVAAQMLHPPMTLRINRRHTTPENYQHLLQECGIAATVIENKAVMLAAPAPIEALPKFKEGWASLQDWGAQQAMNFLSPQEHERILDACAAPGGKTGHILESANCQLTAIDISAARLQKVADNLARLQLSAELVAADAGAWASGQTQQFDAVLADVPCTASGVVKRHPESKWLRQPADALRLQQQNAPLLHGLWQSVRPGGRMLLATCSIFREENEEQAQRFLHTHADAQLSDSLLLLPDAIQDGFYYALFQKNS